MGRHSKYSPEDADRITGRQHYVKVLIDEDEWYPVYSVKRVKRANPAETEHYPIHYIEMSERDVKRFEKAESDFEAAQEELRAIFEKASGL